MKVFCESTDFSSQYSSLEEYVQVCQPKEGEEFELAQVTVISAIKYRMVQSKAVPQSISFAEPVNEQL